MSAPRPAVELVLLWHFHQPDYREPGPGRARLPWVRLHAAKDYLDMARRLESFPGLRVTFNFVPVLADQLDEAAHDSADALFELLRLPVEWLDDDRRRQIATRCLSIPRHALDRWPDLRRLVERVRRPLEAGVLPGDAELVSVETGILLRSLD